MPRNSASSLSRLIEEQSALVERFRALRSAHEAGVLRQQPRSGSWSAAEVCEHLNITAELYHPALRGHIEKLRAAGSGDGDEEIRPGWLIAKFIAMASPKNRRKLKAPKPFHPSPGTAGVEAIDAFVERQEELLGLMGEARGLELNRGKFPSPITSLLRFTLGEGLMLMVRHQQRHAEQAERAAAAR